MEIATLDLPRPPVLPPNTALSGRFVSHRKRDLARLIPPPPSPLSLSLVGASTSRQKPPDE